MPRELTLRKSGKKENYFTSKGVWMFISLNYEILKDDEGLEIIMLRGKGLDC